MARQKEIWTQVRQTPLQHGADLGFPTSHSTALSLVSPNLENEIYHGNIPKDASESGNKVLTIFTDFFKNVLFIYLFEGKKRTSERMSGERAEGQRDKPTSP